MKKILLTILMLLSCLSVFAVDNPDVNLDLSNSAMNTPYKGANSNWYGILVSSWYTMNQYGVIDKNCTLISSQTYTLNNKILDYDIENDINGTDVYISSFSAMNTNGRNCRPLHAHQSKSPEGRLTGAIYSRMKAGLSTTTTIWIITTNITK
jgi:hypothetical protein